MSCSSSPAAYAATTAARYAEPGLSRTQVESLFHELKRQGKALAVPDPTREEYTAAVDRLDLHVSRDSRLAEDQRTRIRAKLAAARTQADLPDGPTFHAITQIGAHSTVTAVRFEHLIAQVARDTGTSTEALTRQVDFWRANPDHYVDYPAPEIAYRYDENLLLPKDPATCRALRRLGYEHYLAQPLPVFVYGTLRRGQGNDRLMDGAVTGWREARMPGVAVHGADWGFPYAAEHRDPDAVTVGELVWLSDDEAGRRARSRLDGLEGFHSEDPHRSLYERVARPVHTVDTDGAQRTVTAWVYLARNTHRDLTEDTRIAHGDWVAARSRPAFGLD